MSGVVERGVLRGPLALMIRTSDEPGALHALTGVLLDHRANIVYVDIAERSSSRGGEESLSTIYFELEGVEGGAAEALVGDLEELDLVRSVEEAPPFS